MTAYESSIVEKKLPNRERKAKRVPGDEMIWLFLLGDMCCFSLFFGMFAHYRFDDLALFQESQALLDVQSGTINTIVLLCSSWLVALALKSAKKGVNRLASYFMAGAAVLGTVFLVLKGMEYLDKSAHEIDYLVNNFWIFYYLITGMHYFHVIIGVPLLLYFSIVLYRRSDNSDTDIKNLESGGLYWHMVDLLWLAIFPLIYLIP